MFDAAGAVPDGKESIVFIRYVTDDVYALRHYFFQVFGKLPFIEFTQLVARKIVRNALYGKSGQLFQAACQDGAIV